MVEDEASCKISRSEIVLVESRLDTKAVTDTQQTDCPTFPLKWSVKINVSLNGREWVSRCEQSCSRYFVTAEVLIMSCSH